MKKILAFALPLLLTVMSTRADLIWYEGFQYTNGSLAGLNPAAPTPPTLAIVTNCVSGGLWLRTSGSATPKSDMIVANSNLQVTATGATVVSRQDDCCRYLATTNGTQASDLLATYGNTNYDTPEVLYASFTVICSTTISNGAGLPKFPNGTYFASFYSSTNYGSGGGGLATTNANGYGYCGRVQAFTNGTILPNTWRLGVTDNGLSANPNNGGFPVDLAVNTPYQVVEEIDPFTLQAASIWVNPISPNQTGNSSVDPKYSASDSMGKMLVYGVNSFAFRQATSANPGYAFLITNLAVATTFGEAMTNVWSTNAVPPLIAYQPVNTTNFVGDQVQLSAVANGQGLANMTYQWYFNGGSLPGDATANNNILTFSSASIGDTGNYTLVATTPYGLSVTSSPAYLKISNTPVPPAFTPNGQPVSQSAFVGQTVSLSCSVISPGNITYTWYSNNVPVSAGQVDSGESSTLTINNVTVASTATYKVAITNDVYPTGIVSTNAVLTVSPIPQVSIAYLRTLVDPSTYTATNSTLPFQVTGTVTTATNLTSGNTSSYYLQDGTAGINIFATFGSTFRPALGDVVTFVGVLSSFSSGLELYVDNTDIPYTTNYANGTSAPLPTPVVIPFTFTNNNYANVNYQIAGERVQLNGVYFGTNAGTAIANGFLAVTNVSGKTAYLWFSSQDTNTLGNILPPYASSVTGVVFGSQNGGSPNFAVAVTQFSDIVAAAPPVLLSAVNSGGTVTLSWSASGYSLQGATSPAGPWSTITGTSPYTFTVPSGDPALGSSAAGFYRLISN